MHVVGRVASTNPSAWEVSPVVGDYFAGACAFLLSATGGFVACRAVALGPAQVPPRAVPKRRGSRLLEDMTAGLVDGQI